MNHIKTFAIALLAVLFFSCSNDDDNPYGFYNYVHSGCDPQAIESYIDGTMDGQIGIYTLLVKNGAGGYTVTSDNEAVVAVDTDIIQEPRSDGGLLINCTLGKAGTAHLTVKDKDNKTVTIVVKVSNATKQLYVVDSQISVDSDNDMLNTQIKNEVGAYTLGRDGHYLLVFTALRSGNIELYNEYGGPKIKEGTFGLSMSGSMPRLTFIYDGEEHLFDYFDPSLKDLGPTKIVFVEDLTEKYQTQYPADNVRKVQCMQELSTTWSLRY